MDVVLWSFSFASVDGKVAASGDDYSTMAAMEHGIDEAIAVMAEHGIT